jgi:DNA-binding transcriptional MerR regulator
MTYRYQLISLTESSRADSIFTDLGEASALCGLHPEMIEEFLRAHLVQAFKSPSGDIYFDQAGIARLRQIAHLREHEHVSLRMVRYIAGLLDSLEARELELRELRERLR